MRKQIKKISRELLTAATAATLLFQAVPAYALSDGGSGDEIVSDYLAEDVSEDYLGTDAPEEDPEAVLLPGDDAASDDTGEKVTITYGDEGYVDLDLAFGAADDNDGDVKVTYYTDDQGVETGIQSIYLEPYIFYDAAGDGNNAQVSSKFIREQILDTKVPVNGTSMTLAEYWGAVASRIFKAADTYGSYDGTDGFDKQFGRAHNDYDCFFNLARVLGDIDSETYGKIRKDYAHSTGWTSFDGGLKDVREKMAREVAKSYDREDKDWDNQVLEAPLNEKDCALPKLKGKDEEGIYNIVVSLNKKNNSSVGYVYNAFGIALYDFDLVPITDSRVDYVTAAQKYKNAENPLKEASDNKAAGVTYLSDVADGNAKINRHANKSFEKPSTGTDTYSEEKTISVSNSVSETNNYTFSQSLKYSPKAELSMLKLFSLSVGTELNVSSNEMFGKTVTDQTTVSQKTTLSNAVPYDVPPHAEETVTFQPVKTTMELDYKLPVALTYKVAIFGTNGYFTSASTAESYYYIAGYDHAYFSTFFGYDLGKNDTAHFASAQADLYDRTVGNKPGYYDKHDVTDGCKHTYGLGHGTYNLNRIDWKAVTQDDDKYITNNSSVEFGEAREALATYLPMCSSGAHMTTTVPALKTTISEVQQLYLPDTIQLVKGQDHYTREIDGTLDMNELEVAAYDTHDGPLVPYKKFDKNKGYWQIMDEHSTPVTDTSVAEMQHDLQGDHAVFHKEGKYFLAWRLSDDAKYGGTEQPNMYATNDTIETAIVKVEVVKNMNDMVDAGTIEMNTGCQVVADDEPIELEHLLEPVLKDDDGVTEVNAEFTWDVQEHEGVKLLESGTADFHEPGLYHFKAFSAGFESDWVEVEAVEARRLTTIRFEIPQNTFEEAEGSVPETENPDMLDAGTSDAEETDGLLLNDPADQGYSDTMKISIGQDHQVLVFPMSYLHYYDQYGEEWNYQTPDIQLALPENSAGAYLNGENLCITQPGSFTVAAFADGFDIAPMFIVADPMEPAGNGEGTENTEDLLGMEDPLGANENAAEEENLLISEDEEEGENDEALLLEGDESASSDESVSLEENAGNEAAAEDLLI